MELVFPSDSTPLTLEAKIELIEKIKAEEIYHQRKTGNVRIPKLIGGLTMCFNGEISIQIHDDCDPCYIVESKDP